MKWLLVGLAACGDHAVAPDAAPSWALYTIEAGQHYADLANNVQGVNPVDGLVHTAGRDYDFIFDASAIYTITNPAEPNDQLDWNKLPGLADCGNIDLSQDGLMFGWRWRLDTQVLEITAYANNAGVHLTPDQPLVSLTAADLTGVLSYRFERTQTTYEFDANGMHATLPRRCTDQPVDLEAFAAGFYFGGTSTAPQVITGQIHERSFE
ncbi:MAG: hypothetical protein QM831_32390 [Kofleriaceae bacterium]